MSAAVVERARVYAGLVKLSHSVFALPFALLSLLVATDGAPSLRLLALVVAAVVAARTAAMAFNRWADRRLDADNPRTAGREIPAGQVSPGAALALALGAGAAFLGCCWLLAPPCFWLGIPTLLWLYGYSYAKRFSSLCHLWLGTALGVAPFAAWFAADGGFGPRLYAPLVLGLAVATWVAGFDVLYACQDDEFDRERGLRSLPVLLGRRGAMWVSRILHLLALAGFSCFGAMTQLGSFYLVGVGLAAALLVWQHRLLRPDDLSRIQAAFFTANGALAVVMFAAGCVDLYL
ncbi:MAG: putative 4-hydroxybenzoate polyprenyltransferase [Planctomycetes bacterium]|nr:putative 4-hydroxybenzoate polyprenyltransferase [Planctomycetota bacterium]